MSMSLCKAFRQVPADFFRPKYDNIQSLALLYVEYKLDGNYMATGREAVNHSDHLRRHMPNLSLFSFPRAG
jgi:hypothetical protein